MISSVLSSTIRPDDIFSKFVPEGPFGRFLNFPLARIPIILLFFAPILVVNSIVVMQVIENLEEPIATVVDVVRMAFTIPLLLLSYHFYCQSFEKRDAIEISSEGAIRQWLTGAIFTAVLVCGFISLIMVFGEY